MTKISPLPHVEAQVALDHEIPEGHREVSHLDRRGIAIHTHGSDPELGGDEGDDGVRHNDADDGAHHGGRGRLPHRGG